MRILHCSHISTTIPEDKARWELNKGVELCFKGILEAATVKTAAVQLLISYPNKTNKTRWALLKQGRTHKRNSPVYQCWMTSKDLNPSAQCGH